MSRYIVILICMILTSNAALAGRNVENRFLGSFLYENAERTAYFAVNNGYSISGPIVAKKRNRSTGGTLSDESLGTEAYDCSDARYRCFKAGRYVIAIPSKQISTDIEYRLYGTVFTVRECLRGTKMVCQVALIEGNCQEILDTSTCGFQEYTTKSKHNPGPIVYFIYNEDFGVTSIGFADERLAEKVWVDKLAREYVLKGDTGILKPARR